MMEASETKHSSGYVKPPWLFQGSALYQLHLVKAATARAFVPKEFRLVEAFGYTLGGLFLAHYDDSPVGMFDELVVIAGIVWNPPTSCAWAARVLVSNQEACHHGRKEVGLPSHVAGFSKKFAAITQKPRDKSNNLLNMIGLGSAICNTNSSMDIEVTEIKGSAEVEFCSIKLPTSVPPESSSQNSWMGPVVKMSLPSFSGRTEYNPQLLKYSCQIECRVRPVKTAKLSGPIFTANNDGEKSSVPQNFISIDSPFKRLAENSERTTYVSGQISTTNNDGEESPGPHNFNSIDSPFIGLAENNSRERSISVLLSKPLLALQFSFLRMQVEAPTVVANGPRME